MQQFSRTFGSILYGLTAFLLAKLYQQYQLKCKLKATLKHLKFLLTVEECKTFKNKSLISLQGIVSAANQNAFIYYKSTCNNVEKMYIQPEILITDQITGSKILGKIDRKSLLFHQDAFNFAKTIANYSQIAPRDAGIIKKMLLSIKYYFSSHTIEEKAIGTLSHQYLTMVGELNFDQNNKPTINISQIARMPENFYKTINQNINKANLSIVIHTILALLLVGGTIYSSYFALQDYLKQQPEKPEQLYYKRQSQIRSDGELCVVCLTNMRNCILLPCLHMILCHECVKIIQKNTSKCPFCRSEIDQLKFLQIDFKH